MITEMLCSDRDPSSTWSPRVCGTAFRVRCLCGFGAWECRKLVPIAGTFARIGDGMAGKGCVVTSLPVRTYLCKPLELLKLTTQPFLTTRKKKLSRYFTMYGVGRPRSRARAARASKTTTSHQIGNPSAVRHQVFLTQEGIVVHKSCQERRWVKTMQRKRPMVCGWFNPAQHKKKARLERGHIAPSCVQRQFQDERAQNKRDTRLLLKSSRSINSSPKSSQTVPSCSKTSQPLGQFPEGSLDSSDKTHDTIERLSEG